MNRFMIVISFLVLSVSVVRFFRQGSAPVASAGADVLGHRFTRRLAVAAQERLDDGQMLAAFLGEAVKIVAGFVVLPGDIAEGTKQRLEPGDLLGQIAV